MKRCPIILLIVCLLLAATTGAASQPPSPDSDVPREHWALDALRQLGNLGLDPGIPEVPNRWMQAFTRRQFAGFIANCAGEIELAVNIGWPDRPSKFRARRSASHLTLLLREFATELRLEGLDTPSFRAAVARFEQLWRDGRPESVGVPLVSRVGRHNAAARAEGERSAREEWERSEAVLYVEKQPHSPDFDLSRSIPYKVIAVTSNATARQRMAGHNAEMWRLLRERGLRNDARLSWLPDLFDLRATWQREGYRALRLDRKHPGAVVPGSDARLVWDQIPQNEHDRRMQLEETLDGRLRANRGRVPVEQALVLDDFPWGEVRMGVPGFPPRCGAMELLWGPTGSGVFFLRLRAPDDGEMPYRLYAMDMRTGAVLNAAASARTR